MPVRSSPTDRIAAGGRLRRKHHRIRPVVDGRGDVRRLGHLRLEPGEEETPPHAVATATATLAEAVHASAIVTYTENAADDAVHHRHGLDRIAAGGRLRRKHHRIRPVVDRGGDAAPCGRDRHRHSRRGRPCQCDRHLHGEWYDGTYTESA
jgi:hypothetical protein